MKKSDQSDIIMEDKLFLTVFTPTYNRAYTLQRVFDSLIKQSDYDFEWLVVDDGSIDNTKSLIQSFIKNAPFKISYVFQENSGKHIATNRAIQLADGYFFLVLDSDDELAENLTHTLKYSWSCINSTDKSSTHILLANCYDYDKRSLIGRQLTSKEYFLPNQNGLSFVLSNNLDYDICGIVKVEFAQQFLFPEDPKVQFIPEAYIWNDMYNKSKLLLIGTVGKIVHYQNDGFTKNIINSYIKHADGRFIYFSHNINSHQKTMLKYAPKRFLKDIVQLGRMSMNGNIPIISTIRSVQNLPIRFLLILFYPICFIFSLLDKKYYYRRIR